MSSFEPAPAAVEPEPATATAESQPQSPSRVEAAVAELDRLPDLELAEHPDLYQRIHTELQGALSAIDDA